MPEYAVIIEKDYKGTYSRYALTAEEFEHKYQNFDNNIPAPTIKGIGYTTRPLVHMWYQLVKTDSELWTQFFTNMFWGLPESDIENNNPAYVALDECILLRPAVENIINETR